MSNAWKVEYFKCGECKWLLKPYDGDAALAHILMHQAEKVKGEK
jgi:hypothetical protein